MTLRQAISRLLTIPDNFHFAALESKYCHTLMCFSLRSSCLFRPIKVNTMHSVYMLYTSPG
ncbi:hypothetical protein RHGRI_006066 [Rhododendron griersonianum]|uniref:Uncharacterized protein n=1 Tax=Rhododendron griersonianum TaxID=479676 RepID=A0AAV6LFJ9_9ERIC|nr:hypothetical protein RHGRI_006066 [Rhododendron griersonianum]